MSGRFHTDRVETRLVVPEPEHPRAANGARSGGPAPTSLLALQRSAGNAAVRRLLARPRAGVEVQRHPHDPAAPSMAGYVRSAIDSADDSELQDLARGIDAAIAARGRMSLPHVHLTVLGEPVPVPPGELAGLAAHLRAAVARRQDAAARAGGHPGRSDVEPAVPPTPIASPVDRVRWVVQHSDPRFLPDVATALWRAGGGGVVTVRLPGGVVADLTAPQRATLADEAQARLVQTRTMGPARAAAWRETVLRAAAREAEERLWTYVRDVTRPTRLGESYYVHNRDGRPLALSREDLHRVRRALRGELHLRVETLDNRRSSLLDGMDHIAERRPRRDAPPGTVPAPTNLFGRIHDDALRPLYQQALQLAGTGEDARRWADRGRFDDALGLVLEGGERLAGIGRAFYAEADNTQVAQWGEWAARFVRDTTEAIFATLAITAVTIASGGTLTVGGALAAGSLTAGVDAALTVGEHGTAVALGVEQHVDWAQIATSAVLSFVTTATGARLGSAQFGRALSTRLAAALVSSNPGLSATAARRIAGLAIATSRHEFTVAVQSTLSVAAEDARHGRQFTLDQVLDRVAAQHTVHTLLQQAFAQSAAGRLAHAARPGRLAGARERTATAGDRAAGAAGRDSAGPPARSAGAAAHRPPTTEEVRDALVERRVADLAAEVARLRGTRGTSPALRNALRSAAAAVLRLERGFWSPREEGPPGQRRTVVRARDFRLRDLVAVEQRVAALRAAVSAGATAVPRAARPAGPTGPAVTPGVRGHRVLSTDPGLAERFRLADEDFVRGGGRGPRPSVAFARAAGALEQAGLRAQLDAVLAEVFRPRVAGAELARARLLRGVAQVTELADLVRTRPEVLTRAGLTRLAEELSGEFHRIEADYRRGQAPDGSRLPAHLWRSTDGRPRAENRIDRAAARVREEVANSAANPGGSPLEVLLGLLRVRRRIASLTNELRAHVSRFEVAVRVGRTSTASGVEGVDRTPVVVTATGRVTEGIFRRDYEDILPSAGALAELEGVTPARRARLARLLAGYHRAHLVGPGLGAELVEGIMFAPAEVNLGVQNAGVEEFLRTAAAAPGTEVTLRVQAHGQRLTVPRDGGAPHRLDVLTRIEYRITVTHGDNPRVLVVAFTVGAPPAGRVTMVRNDIPPAAPGGAILADPTARPPRRPGRR